MDQMLLDRNIVVTGGSGALGRVVVARLLRAGALCHVPVHRSAGTLAQQERLHVVSGVDLRDEVAVDRFYDALPGLWASVHVAGGFAGGSLVTTTRDDFLHMMEMNALTAFLCSRAAVRVMRRGTGGGRIVNISSRPGVDLRSGAGVAAYAASKAAVTALTVALAEELKGEGILVNAIAPSTLDTPANRSAVPDADFAKWLSPEAAAEAVLQLVLPVDTAISGAVLPLYARA